MTIGGLTGDTLSRSVLAMRITFEKVSVKGVRRWTENGRKRQETREFYQTVNPFNKNPDGSVKTKEQIREQILEERNKWLTGGCV